MSGVALHGGRVAVVGLILTASAHGQTLCGEWTALPGPEVGGPSPNAAYVYALEQWDDGTGLALYVGGQFVGADARIRNVAKRVGETWVPLGNGLPGRVFDLAVFDDGSGEALYAAGDFSIGTGINRFSAVAKWDGGAWQIIGGPFTSVVNAVALQVYDDGDGPGLYVATQSGIGQDLGSLAVWRNGTWTSVIPSGKTINAMTVFDDGSGPALYVGGEFTSIGGVPAVGLARYRRGEWSDVGSGVWHLPNSPGQVNALNTFDDGRGPMLLVAGRFSRVNGQFTGCMAGWRGGAWTTFRHTPPFVVVFSDGPQTVAGLRYASTPTVLGGTDFWYVEHVGGARVAGGLLGHTDGRFAEIGAPGHRGVSTMLVVEDSPQRAQIIVGGRLGVDPPYPTLAVWTACRPCYANCDLSAQAPVLNINDFVCFQARFVAGDPAANCDGSTLPPVLNVEDFVCFTNAFIAGCP